VKEDESNWSGMAGCLVSRALRFELFGPLSVSRGPSWCMRFSSVQLGTLRLALAGSAEMRVSVYVPRAAKQSAKDARQMDVLIIR
jgi:hypothetical protein